MRRFFLILTDGVQGALDHITEHAGLDVQGLLGPGVGLSAEDFTDLREEDAAYFEKLFRSPEKFQRFAGRLVISKVVPGGV